MTRIVAAAVAGLAIILLGDTSPRQRPHASLAQHMMTEVVRQPILVDGAPESGQPGRRQPPESTGTPIIDAAMTLPAGRLQDAIREAQARIEVERAITGTANYYSDAPEMRRQHETEAPETQPAGGALRMTDCAHGNPFPVRKHGPIEGSPRPQVNRHLLDLELGPTSSDPLRIS